jgi:hypothetical protein
MSKKNTASDALDSVAHQSVEQPVNRNEGQEISMKDYHKTSPFSFSKENYRLLLIGLAINILGFILMIGGASDNPNKWDGDALFSHVRITLAPFLIVAGYVVIMFSIMRKPKAE